MASSGRLDLDADAACNLDTALDLVHRLVLDIEVARSIRRTRMSQPHSFSRFAYFDTNVLSELAKSPGVWRPLQEHLLREDLTIALSGQAAELSEAERLHDGLVALFLAMPSAIIKSMEDVLAEEVRAHPASRTDSLLLYPLNAC